jgi:hypothetical protein
MLDFLFHELDKHLGIKAIHDEKGLLAPYLLKINDSLEVWVRELTPQGILFKSIVGTLILNSDRESVFSHFMQANFLGQGTGGAVLSLDPDEKFLTLSLTIPYEGNYRIFRDKLEDFINYLEFWKSELKRLESRQI